jgi:MtN3 and saliva related transmembrane protein
MELDIGLIAGLFTTFAYAPQVWKAARSRSAGDLSLVMYLCMTLGALLWIIYGVEIGSWPVIIWNIVTMVMTSTMIVLRLRYGGTRSVE